MKGRRNEKLNGGFRRRLVAQGKLHCLAKLTVYVHICYVCDRLYTSWRVKATLRYRFKTLDRKPRPPKPIRRQSYIGPTTVGPDIISAYTCSTNILCLMHIHCSVHIFIAILWERLQIKT